MTANGTHLADPSSMPDLSEIPHDAAAERCTLAAMMLSRDAIADVLEVLRPEDHYRPAHQMIHEAIFRLYSRPAADGKPVRVDAVTVADELGRTGELARVGGALYLHTCIHELPSAANAGHYARIVRDHAILRSLDSVGTRIVQSVRARLDADPRDLVDRAAADLLGITVGRDGDELTAAAEILPGALDEIEAIARNGVMTGVPTGFADLDALTNGLHPGQMIVVAARVGFGKSTVGMDFARSAAIKHGLPTAFFSLEMSRNELMMRMLSAEARVPLQGMRTGTLTDDDWDRLSRFSPGIAGAPLFIDTSPDISVSAIRAKCRRLQHQHGLKFVIVDYLQLMSSPRRTENRQVEVAEISRGLKLLAKELDVPVVAISQLNRGPEQRQDKRPLMSDLRESGAVEADADVVILIFREDAYDKESPRAGEADLIVAKHRNGPTATVTVAAQLHYSRFVDMHREPSPPPRAHSQPVAATPPDWPWSPSRPGEEDA
jgi:replicative DNA helicase